MSGFGSIHFTLHLRELDDDVVTARDASFYVALFKDEERTEMISAPHELHFMGMSSNTCVFENVPMDQPLYVGVVNEDPEYGWKLLDVRRNWWSTLLA